MFVGDPQALYASAAKAKILGIPPDPVLVTVTLFTFLD
jgi:hypothetical protein